MEAESGGVGVGSTCPFGGSAIRRHELIAGPLYRLGTLLRGGKSLSWTTNTAIAWPAYMIFERKVLKRFRAELRRSQFDLIHRR